PVGAGRAQCAGQPDPPSPVCQWRSHDCCHHHRRQADAQAHLAQSQHHLGRYQPDPRRDLPYRHQHPGRTHPWRDEMNQSAEHFDAIAIGAGPFNLGFAALTDGLEDLKVAVLDASEKFVWHPGMMLPGTHLQVPFMADLVTMADPTSKHSFLNYLKEQGRIYPFYIRENFYALREEYSNYLAWAATNISSVRFGHRVLEAEYREGRYHLSVLT